MQMNGPTKYIFLILLLKLYSLMNATVDLLNPETLTLPTKRCNNHIRRAKVLLLLFVIVLWQITQVF